MTMNADAAIAGINAANLLNSLGKRVNIRLVGKDNLPLRSRQLLGQLREKQSLHIALETERMIGRQCIALVVSIFICVVYMVPYVLIKMAEEMGIPWVIMVAGMVAFVAGLIALAAVAVEQHRTI